MAGGAPSIARFAVYLVALDPTVGSEIRKSRPCVVVSPNELNDTLRTAIVAPLTRVTHHYPTRVPCRFAGVAGEIAVDQIRSVDKSRLIKHIGHLDAATQTALLETLAEMFAP